MDTLNSWATTGGAELAVCTRKDLVKLQTDHLGSIPLWALAIDVALHLKPSSKVHFKIDKSN